MEHFLIQYGLIFITITINFWKLYDISEKMKEAKENRDKLWVKYDELQSKQNDICEFQAELRTDIKYIKEKLDSLISKG